MLYPPGIPVIMPGERFDPDVPPIVRFLQIFAEWADTFPGFENEMQGVTLSEPPTASAITASTASRKRDFASPAGHMAPMAIRSAPMCRATSAMSWAGWSSISFPLGSRYVQRVS